MRIVKFGLLSLVFLFLIVTAITALIPSSVIVSRTIDINAPVDSVYADVNDLATWKSWLQQFDSSQFKVSAVSKGPGASLTIYNETTNSNTIVTIKEVSPKFVRTIWQVGSAKPLPGDFYFITKPGIAVTTLQWQFIQKVKWYPWQKISLIFSDKAFGPYMEKSLDNLKSLIEGNK